jgi:putative FmdB family regulatory protein
MLSLSWGGSFGGFPLPLYEYRCTSCGYTFEKIQSFSAKPEAECPKCQGVLIRPVTAPALRFEGAGWYVNDYAGKGGAKAGEASGTAEKPATGSADAAANKSSDASGGEASSATVVPAASATSTSAAAPAAPAKS